MFPSVCHIHYPAITRTIRHTAAEYGVRYNVTSFWGMMGSYFRFLKKMGAGEAPGTFAVLGADDCGYDPAYAK